MSNDLIDFSGLDAWTEKVFEKLEKEYPEKVNDFLTKQMEQCKAEAVYRTKKGPTGNLKKAWKVKIIKRNGHNFGVLKNSSPHAPLIESGHITKNGGWFEGHHMLEKTMTNRQPFIDKEIEKLVDEIYDI